MKWLLLLVLIVPGVMAQADVREWSQALGNKATADGNVEAFGVTIEGLHDWNVTESRARLQIQAEYFVNGGDSLNATFSKIANPADLPTGNAVSADWSSDGNYLAIGHVTNICVLTTCYITVYRFDPATQVLTKLADPNVFPTGTAQGVSWHPSGEYLAVAHRNSPYLTVYRFDKTAETLTKLANPGTLPGAQAWQPEWSQDGSRLAVVSTDVPRLTVYDFNLTSETFAAWAAPATPPTGETRGVAWAPNDEYLATAHFVSPFVTIYDVDLPTKVLTKLPNPSQLPTGSGFSAVFSSDMQYLFIGHSITPWITQYAIDLSTMTFTKQPPPDVLPAGGGEGVDVTISTQYLAIAHGDSPRISVYAIDQDTGALNKIPDPDVVPTGGGRSAAWTVDQTFLAVAHTSSPFVSVYEFAGESGFPQWRQQLTLDSLTIPDCFWRVQAASNHAMTDQRFVALDCAIPQDGIQNRTVGVVSTRVVGDNPVTYGQLSFTVYVTEGILLHDANELLDTVSTLATLLLFVVMVIWAEKSKIFAVYILAVVAGIFAVTTMWAELPEIVRLFLTATVMVVVARGFYELRYKDLAEGNKDED